MISVDFKKEMKKIIVRVELVLVNKQLQANTYRRFSMKFFPVRLHYRQIPDCCGLKSKWPLSKRNQNVTNSLNTHLKESIAANRYYTLIHLNVRDHCNVIRLCYRS